MARPNKVWYRSDTGWWMVTLGGKKTRLIRGPNDELHRQLAEEKWMELRKVRRRAPEGADARVADLIEVYLRHVKANLSEDSYRVTRSLLQGFAEACGQIKATEFKPFHLSRWIDERVNSGLWGEGMAGNGKKFVCRLFSWSKEEGFIQENPLAGIRRSKPLPRQRGITSEEFKALHANAHPAFADFLFALYRTGARPKELRDLRWENVREDRLIVRSKTRKKTGKERVIYIDPEVKALLEKLRRDTDGKGHVFRNTKGRPWKRDAVVSQMLRLRRRLGLADDLCCYLCRHGFGTRAIKSGVNPAVVAELMGHANLDMVSKVYVHLDGEHDHLREAVEKANQSGLT